MTQSRKDKAAAFHALHAPGKILALPNAWDAGSARVMQESGAPAVATSSAAVAWAHGCADGEVLSFETLLNAVREIARAIDVPLTVDMEAGFAGDGPGVDDHVSAVIEAGGIGANLEDGSNPPELLAAKIEAAKRAGSKAGVNFFVNARVDVYLAKLVPAEKALDETLTRAKLYQAAGADGIFVPGVIDAATLKTIAQAIDRPLNAMIRPGAPPVAELKALGVRRVSTATGMWRAAHNAIRNATQHLLRDGTYTLMNDVDPTLFNANAFFARR